MAASRLPTFNPIWSYMRVSIAGAEAAPMEMTYSMKPEALLENLALPPRGLPELRRRHAGGAMEGADEIGEVVETDVIGDVGHRFVVVGKVPRGTAQPRAHQILMRGNAERGREQPQEMERAD